MRQTQPTPDRQPPDPDAVLADVGERIRRLRRSRGRTLAEMAELTGLTVSSLSRLETGKRRPSLEQLLVLARVFVVPLDDLVGAGSLGDPRVHLRPVSKHGMTYVPLTRRAGGIQAFKVIYPPASNRGALPPRTHEGYEWFYVIDGRVRLRLGGETWELGPGEAAEFDTGIPHTISSAGEQPAEVLTLFGTDGERSHLTVSARTRRTTRPGGRGQA